jgi:paired amphipathic helix protein Sin3a
VFKKDEKTYAADELASTARWSYYISTFSMRDRTEGIELGKLQLPFLKRNMPSMLADEDDYTNAYGTPQWNDDGLVVRISQDSYHLLYDPTTSDWWVHNNDIRKRGLGAQEELQKERNDKFVSLFGEKGALAATKFGDQFEAGDAKFRQGIQDGVWGDDEGIHGSDGVMSGT